MPSRYIDVTLPFIGKVPMTRLGISLLSLVLVAGVALGIYVKVYRDPEVLLLNVTEANKQLKDSLEEYGRHMMEAPTKHEMFEDADGTLALRVFPDHCVLIQRSTRNGVRTKLILDLAREGGKPSVMADLLAVPLAADGLGPPHLPVVAPQAACARGCLNPHLGQFNSWYGARDGCWIEVWRQWSDGCTHVQMFQSCSGYWDSNTDGSPKIRWVCCVH